MENLLNENRSLKSTIGLLTHCREISSQIEMEPVAQATLKVLASLVQATSAFMVSRLDDESCFRFLATQGISCQEAKAISDRVDPFRVRYTRPSSRMKWIQDIRGPMLIARLQTQHAPSTSVVLTFDPQEEPNRKNLDRIQVVTLHAAQALDNASRFERAQNLSFTDDVTGLYNIRYLELFLDKELHRAKRLNYPVSFLFMDMDHFKKVNDGHGHLIGSGLLILVAKELKNLVRDGDVVVRYGGDEYVLILINTPAKDAKQVAERIRKRIETFPFKDRLGLGDKGTLPPLTASIGIATFPQHAKDCKTVLRLADQAMYEAKKNRNAVHLSST